MSTDSGMSLTWAVLQFLALEQNIVVDEAKANVERLKERFEKNKIMNDKFGSK